MSELFGIGKARRIMSGSCKWAFAVVNGVKTHISEVESAQHGICPLCGAELVARKGSFRTEHWWHINGTQCDDWYQPKGAWHRYWQDKFPRDWQERVIQKPMGGRVEKHIADVLTSNDLVVEAQWSPISPDEIHVREHFYGNMVWIVGMNRISSDHDFSNVLKQGQFDIDGRRGYCFQNVKTQKWCHCSKTVLMDFNGEMDEPCANKRLVVLLPENDESAERVCFAITQDEVIETIRMGKFHEFEAELKQLTPKFLSQLHIDQEREAERERKRKEDREKELERRHAEWKARQERRQAKDAKDLPYYAQIVGAELAEVFVAGRFGKFIEVALTIGWVEAHLICVGVVEEMACTAFDMTLVPALGRIVVHFKPNYTQQEFEQDYARVREVFGRNRIKPMSYQGLEKRRGKIAGAVDCMRMQRDGEEVLAFRRGHFLDHAFDSWRTSDGFWRLSQRQSMALTNIDQPLF